MKHIKNRNKFLNESFDEEEDRVGAINNVNFKVDDTMESIWKSDYDMTVRDEIGSLINELSLVSGFIHFTSNFFRVDGIDKDGMKIHIRQFGRFNGYGGPSTPHMDKPEIEFNDIDVYPLLKFLFKKYGYIEGDEQVDVSRPDMYPMQKLKDYMNAPEEERENFLKSDSSIKKYNM